ncbi:NitT/TauT family transport system permease protein [Aliiruegeria haliotis]|uniref:NitT/TauT family transport system permease protein n=1 Tax=Aliiruegeria haliotis TaxID=1280846 RepID=A0A2T0RIK1_9RHOB|nr:ABC transporter permease [Aliiruegeria haliotis]PRY20979.1 NitT/TauT family transport system permease protein [Aliiruegeria haliotis]
MKSLYESQWVATVVAIVAAALAWQGLSIMVDQPLIAPGVGDIAEAAWKNILSGALFENLWASLYRVFVGFAIATVLAIPFGFLLGWYPAVRRFAEPYVQFMRVIPPIALIPLLIIYLGIGEPARIFVIALAAFLAIVVAVYQGVWEVDPVLVRAARVLGAKETSIFAEVVVPATFPYILVGMRQGLANAWGSLVAAELIASSKGLGYMIMSSQENFRVPDILVGILTIGIIGVLMDRGLLYAQSRLTPWKD